MFLFFYFIFDFIVFQNLLGRFQSYWSYLDEFITIFIVIFSGIALLNKKRRPSLFNIEKLIIIMYFCFIGIGLISTKINEIQPVAIARYKDILAISKFVVMYIGGLILSNDINKELLLSKLAKKSRIYITIIFICGILEELVGIGMSGEIRYGIKCYKFMFSHPTYLVSAMGMLFSVILANKDKKKYDKFIIFEALFVILITVRNKGFTLILAYIIIGLILKYKESIKISHLLLILIVGFIMSSEKIKEVFYYGLTAARPALYIVGLKIARDYFPLGSGFGSFSSSISGEYYSPIYSQYGINNVMGLMENSYGYIGDTFWPYIYGQFGIIGFMFFVVILVCIYISIKQRYFYSYDKKVAAFTIFAYIIIASGAESIFTDSIVTYMFLIMSVYLGKNLVNFKDEKYKDANKIGGIYELYS